MTHQAKKVPAAEQAPLTPAMRKKAQDLLNKAKVQLAIHQPFFGQIVLGRKIFLEDNVQTAYVTPRGRIHVGVRFLAEGGPSGDALTVQQVVFLLAHEAMHYAMLHTLRRAHRDPRNWNVACDAVINDVLKESKVGEFIPNGVDMPGSKDKTSEKVYEELPRNSGGKGRGQGQGQGDYQPGTGQDDLSEEGDDDEGPIDQAAAREIEENVRTTIAAAAQVAKSKGNIPAGLERLVEEIVNPKTPWHQLLERYMTSFIKSGISWRRPNRRMMGLGHYLPSHDLVPKMGSVVVVVDTSGSIGPKELSHFLGHINAIIERCRPEKVYVMPCDAKVHGVTELTLEDLPITQDMAKKMSKGGGGTSFKPPFRKVDKLGIEPEVLVYLTDMMGDFPEAAPHYSTIWLSTSNIDKAPFGDVIMYQMDEQD